MILKVYIYATEAEAEDVSKQLGRSICPDPNHPGYCPVPCSIETTRPTGRNRAFYLEHFNQERAAAEGAGDAWPHRNL